MRCWHKVTVYSVASLLGLTSLSAKDDKPKTEKSKNSKGDPTKGDSKKKDKDAPRGANADNGMGKRMSIPMVEGPPSKGVHIPYYGPDGKLQMNFTIKVATKVDADHMKMSEAQVETFDAKGETEMVIDLPESTLDLNTRIITTNQHVTIKRSDFEITGQNMEFNTETREGKLGGKVRMLIYNLSGESDAKAEEQTGEKPNE